MLPIALLDHLIAFTLTSLGGALLCACHCKYVGKVRRDSHASKYKAGSYLSGGPASAPMLLPAVGWQVDGVYAYAVAPSPLCGI